MERAERLSMLAAAVAGRNVAVLAGTEERAYSDGERIVLGTAGDDEGLVVQAAMLAAGSFDPRTVLRLTGRRRLRHRYLTLEAMRAVDSLSGVVPRRVCERVAAIYDGTLAGSAEESLARAQSQAEDVPEAPEWVGTIRPGKVMLAASPLGGVAPSQRDLDGAAGEADMPELDDDENSDGSKILDLFRAPAFQNPLARQLQKLLGMGRAPGADGAAAEEVPVGSRSAGRVGADARVVPAAPAAPQLDLQGAPVGRLYPEWDWRSRRYRRDWCSVAEFDPRPPEVEPLFGADRDVRLLRELARIGLAHERHRRQHEGDDLDITALVELVVARSTGVDGDPRVYKLKRRTAHDLGVLVLLDATGSIAESDEGARVFDEQREIAARLTSALDELGNRVAAYGFQSWGRNSVRFLRVKGFDDSYDEGARHRLASLEPAGFTRLGAAIRHGTHLLAERAGTSSTLLVVIGDGLPYDDGYEDRYAHEDCRRALADAVREGIGCACMSVRSSTEPVVLGRVWARAPHLALDGPGELVQSVAPLFRRALDQAAASRRRVGPDEEAAR